MLSVKKSLLQLTLLLLPGIITAQDLSFNLNVTQAKNPEPLVVKVYASGSKIAMEPQGMGAMGKMTVIMDNSTGKQYMLMNANGQKMAMAMNMEETQKAVAEMKEPKVTVTKETKTIDGYKCTKVITETDDHTTDLWITPDVGMQYSEFYKMFNSAKSTQGAATKIPELKNVKGFPIEIVSTDKKKAETVTLKIKDISKAKIDQKVFSTEGYQMMDAPKSTH